MEAMLEQMMRSLGGYSNMSDSEIIQTFDKSYKEQIKIEKKYGNQNQFTIKSTNADRKQKITTAKLANLKSTNINNMTIGNVH